MSGKFEVDDRGYRYLRISKSRGELTLADIDEVVMFGCDPESERYFSDESPYAVFFDADRMSRQGDNNYYNEVVLRPVDPYPKYNSCFVCEALSALQHKCSFCGFTSTDGVSGQEIDSSAKFRRHRDLKKGITLELQEGMNTDYGFPYLLKKAKGKFSWRDICEALVAVAGSRSLRGSVVDTGKFLFVLQYPEQGGNLYGDWLSEPIGEQIEILGLYDYNRCVICDQEFPEFACCPECGSFWE